MVIMEKLNKDDDFLDLLRGKLMTTEQYIEHEVKLRVHDERFKSMDAKLNWIITLVVSGLILPIILHAAKLV
jgi:hypothetical protein